MKPVLDVAQLLDIASSRSKVLGFILNEICTVGVGDIL
jgi:hypothetical protein